MKNFKIISLVIVILIEEIASDEYYACDLAKKMHKEYAVPKGVLNEWVCFVDNILETNKKIGPLEDGSYNYGVFQINTKKWCEFGKIGGICNIDCDSLLDENISDDIFCLKKLFDEQEAFNRTDTEQNKCVEMPENNNQRCFKESSSTEVPPVLKDVWEFRGPFSLNV